MALNIAVIPARGGSKRIPRKNIKPFGGKPMIAYAIQAARDSGLFEHVVVSTDDDEIAAVAQAHGASVPFRRPAHLADDQTVTVPVIAHAAQWFVDQGHAVDAVCCIYPCVPLLRAADLQGAYAMFQERGADYVYPVVGFHSSPWRAMTKPEHGPMQFVYPEYELTRTQDLPKCYFDAGQFYWGKTAAWTSGLRMHSHGHGYEVEGHRIVDIDTHEDWARAELIARAL
ncbi:MAG: pseudaminic acid cytidylyltransferase [Rubrivivax sp.]|jgi:pseudaminic acid cytidylyltransferase